MKQKIISNIKKFKKVGNKKSSVSIAEPKINYNADESRFFFCDDCERTLFNIPKVNLLNDYEVNYDRFLF